MLLYFVYLDFLVPLFPFVYNIAMILKQYSNPPPQKKSSITRFNSILFAKRMLKQANLCMIIILIH